MGDVRDKLLAHDLEPLLTRDIVEHEQRARSPRRIERGNDRAGHLDPDGRASVHEFNFLLRGRKAATDGLDVAEKRGAVQNGFEPLAEDVHRLREDFVQCLIGQKDVVVSVDDQHRFTETAERGLELRQLAAAELLEMVHLLD